MGGSPLENNKWKNLAYQSYKVFDVKGRDR
jgi:hypothetical protein